ncbi:oxidoreductase [Pantoea sp. CS_6]|uniref:carboxymuconolactone decarboxylase family protein n=1 Tax=Pantoea sp. CS_6 TaxID=3055795 RepID=UPI0035BF46DB
MQQRRYTGQDHWFYESQTCPRTVPAAPLFPEAAHIDDRFLLGLAQETSSVQPLLQAGQPAIQIAHEIVDLLFPDQVDVTLTHTLTLYDRLSSALTVAQVTGIQRLCNHYSARLNPLPGPDSSRESNNRLTQITQYARLLAMQPTLITADSVRALHAAGLSEADIVTLNQLVGFVCYQARVIAGIHALLNMPVRWIPGMSPAPDAPATDAPGVWQPVLKPLEPRYASEAQHKAVAQCQTSSAPEDALWLLAHAPALLEHWYKLNHQEETVFTVGVEATAASLLGNRWRPPSLTPCSGQAGAFDNANLTDADRAVSALTALLTRQPERFCAADLQPLQESGWSVADQFALIQAIARANWNSRLFYACGEAR